MSILDRYLWWAVLTGLIMAWFALTGLVVFFDFISETSKLNENYSSLQAFIYLLYSVPSKLYELFPSAILIGTLLGLGNIAANSEFIAMRAAGISIINIILSVLKLGLLLVVCVFFLGELVVPKTDMAGKNFKASLDKSNVVMVSGGSLWVKDKNRIFHIGQVWSVKKLTDITIYKIDKNYSGLNSLTHVQSATSSRDGWLLESITVRTIRDTGVSSDRLKNSVDNDFLDAKLLSIASVTPEELSITELSELIDHQKANNLNTERFELAYWKRFSAPLAALVMLFLAMPFLFGSQRGGGAGQRVFIGIIVGVAFFLINKVLSQVGSVYGFPPFFSAFMPSMLFFTISIIAIRKTK